MRGLYTVTVVQSVQCYCITLEVCIMKQQKGTFIEQNERKTTRQSIENQLQKNVKKGGNKMA